MKLEHREYIEQVLVSVKKQVRPQILKRFSIKSFEQKEVVSMTNFDLDTFTTGMFLLGMKHQDQESKNMNTLDNRDIEDYMTYFRIIKGE